MSGSIQNDSNDSIHVKLKSTSESREHEVIIPSFSTATVEILKQITHEKLHVPNDKNIRLIYLGKLLDPPSVLLSTFNLKSGAFIHVAVSEKRPEARTFESSSSSSSTVINSPHSTVTLPPRSSLRGLDILTSRESDETFPNALFRSGLGLSANEVAALRSSFRSTIDEYIQENSESTARLENEDDLSYRLRMETLWLQSLDENSEFYLNLPMSSHNRIPLTSLSRLQRLYGLNFVDDRDLSGTNPPFVSEQQALGTYHDYVWGFFMGFFLGFITIFCIWDRNVTQRQKLGIVCGVMFQMILNSVAPPSQHAGYHSNTGGNSGTSSSTTSTTTTTGDSNSLANVSTTSQPTMSPTQNLRVST